MSKIDFTVNGTRHVVEADDDTPLLWLIRDNLGLSGTKFGCGVGVCGACTVLEDGKAVRACQVPAAEASSRNFVTIEGLSPDLSHPCQCAWLQEEVAQCGYCQAGMIMTACGLLQQHPDPSDELVRLRADSPRTLRAETAAQARSQSHRLLIVEPFVLTRPR